MKSLTMRERFKITKRGFGILNKYCPGLPQGKALAALVSSLQPFASIWLSAQIINEISGEKRVNVLAIYVCAVLLINLAAAILRGCIDKITDQKEAQMWNFFGKVFSDKQMSMDYADLENAGIQHQRKKAEVNLFMFGNGLAQLVWGTAGLVTAFVNIVVSISMTVTLFTQGSGNAVIDAPFWVIILLALILFGGFCNQKATVKENEVFRKWCESTVWFNRTFMFFGRELYMTPERAKDVRIYKQHHIADQQLGKMMKHDRKDNNYIFKMALPSSVAAVIVGIGNAACYLFIVLKAFFGAFGVGSIVRYVGVLSRLGDGVQQLMYIFGDNETYCGYLRELYEYLDHPGNMRKGSLTVPKGDDNEYYVEFRDVSFKYPNTGVYVLRHVSIRFKVGEKIAVVGMNSSGKTTFIKLMCRLYDPTEGEILLNGVDIRNYNYDEYMSVFSVVFQDFRLFAYTLGQNVAASCDFDRERALECLRRAGFNERLESMPRGLDTYIYKNFSNDGVEISGGEAQKIALARALYKNAPFIILDEPTAALDPVSEYEVYSSFNGIVGDKTVIYISHRLASCRFCDEIAVFDNGEIIQRGSHNELVADTNGKYHGLWYAQAQYYAE